MLGLVPVEPAYRAVVDFKVELSALMANTNSVKHRSTALNILQVDKSCDCYSFSWLGLESITMEEDVSTVCVGSISTLTVGKVYHYSSILHVAVVGVARGIFHNVPFGSVELNVCYKTLWKRKEIPC